ncbi:membrane protein [Chitinophaga cymbidii]|uniref:Membrane protein n=2 Tax=Chitinophaga cymbidii TaxID=1096750 RepID=A0A512RFM8_9BACT|nr:membrane protein [Chitinophaga cymbidii]
MLDYALVINSNSPSLGEESSDDFYMEDAVYSSLDVKTRNSYIWKRDIFEGIGGVIDWNSPYQQVFYANIILDQLNSVKDIEKNTLEFNRIKGAALFLRSYAFCDLLQTFALPFDESTAETDLGVPLKLSSDVNIKPERASIQHCYDQIINDLVAAENLMTNNVDYDHPNRASKPAVFALLSRIYHYMRKYELSEQYATKCLNIYNNIVDFNSLNTSASNPFGGVKAEGMIYLNKINPGLLFHSLRSNAIIDSSLYMSYDDNDLRKSVLFIIRNNKPFRKTSMGGSGAYFTGLSTEEVILNRAECYARSGKHDLAMKDLNDLLVNRYKADEFSELTASSASEALGLILKERRKELVFRGIRWSDIRRLNKEGANITLRRIIAGVEYTLPPNDKRYALPIPPDEMLLNPMPQNER